MTTSATAAAAAKIAKPKKLKRVTAADCAHLFGSDVSHAKQEQAPLPLPGVAEPEFGQIDPKAIIVLDQVRKDFKEEGLRELAEDIAERGILQPLTVRKTDSGVVLVAGERRLRAAILANLVSVPVLISAMDESKHALSQLAENIQREDLSLAEEASGIKLLYDDLGSVKAVAERVHKSVSWVSKRLSLSAGLGHYAAALMADGITEDIELLQAVDKLDKATPGSNSAWALCEKIRAGKAGRTEAREALQMVKTRQEIANNPPTATPKQEAAKPHPADRLWEQYRGQWLATHEVGTMYAIAKHLPDAPDFTDEMAQWKAFRSEELRLEELLNEVRAKRRKLELHRMEFTTEMHTVEQFRTAYDQSQKKKIQTIRNAELRD
jgi:ParB/RepB/Spo0J family partition protein